MERNSKVSEDFTQVNIAKGDLALRVDTLAMGTHAVHEVSSDFVTLRPLWSDILIKVEIEQFNDEWCVYTPRPEYKIPVWIDEVKNWGLSRK